MSVRRQNLKEAAELLRKGASLLKEPCPRCGGVLLLYQGSYLCPSCGTIDQSSAEASRAPAKPVQKNRGELEVLSVLEKVISGKLIELHGRLQSISNFDEELKYTSLLKSYLEVLRLIQQIKHSKSGA